MSTQYKTVKAGQPVPLSVTIGTGSSNKVIVADVYNAFTMSLLAANIPLAHQFNGLYFSNAFTMPNLSMVFVQYRIFESDQSTPSIDTDQVAEDNFILDVQTFTNTLVGLIEEETNLIGVALPNHVVGIASGSELLGVLSNE